MCCTYFIVLHFIFQPDYNMSRRGRWDKGMAQKYNMKHNIISIYCEKLKEYSNKKSWPQPVYKILPRYPKDSRPLFGCQVKVSRLECSWVSIKWVCSFVLVGVVTTLWKSYFRLYKSLWYFWKMSGMNKKSSKFCLKN